MNARHPKDSHDLGDVARELLEEFLDDANAGQTRAILDAARRTIRSEKAAPVRAFARELNEASGYLFTRALSAFLPPRTNKRG